MLRGQILGIDRLFKKGLDRGVMIGVTALAFFLMENFAQDLLSERLGIPGGLAAAGGVLAFQEKVMKLINRSTSLVMEVSGPIEGNKDQLYRDQFLTARVDGALSGKDRRMLRIAANALGLTDNDCARIESDLVPG